MPDAFHITFNQEGGSILYYEYEFSKHKGVEATKKEAFQEVTVEPELTNLFIEGDNLLQYVQANGADSLQQFQSSKNSVADEGGTCILTKVILYSSRGFANRSTIKQELESKMETRNLRLCLGTCCCAICFAACCKCCRDFADAEEIDLNEESYCRILQEQFPTETEEADHKFV